MTQPKPVLLRGAAAIGAHLGISARAAQAMHQQGRLPTFRKGGTPFATAGALDDWSALQKTAEGSREVDATASTSYTHFREGDVSDKAIDYEAPLYKLSDAARVSNVPLNTLRSYYARDDFRIVKGVKKEGRGITSLLTLKDVMCIAVACRLIEAGSRPASAFKIAMRFAYFSSRYHQSSQKTTDKAFLILVAYPSSVGQERIVATDGDLPFLSLFSLEDMTGIISPVLVVLNAVEHQVLAGLGFIEDGRFDPLPLLKASSEAEGEPNGD